MTSSGQRGSHTTPRGLERRWTVLGAIGAFVLSAVFFYLGLTILGPYLSGGEKAGASKEDAAPYADTLRSSSPPAYEHVDEPPKVNVRISEHKPSDESSAERAAQDEVDGVRQDESGLTVTLTQTDEGRANESADRRPETSSQESAGENEEQTHSTEPALRPEGSSQPGATSVTASELVKPRAATEPREPVSGRLYGVQVGSYSRKADAEKLAEELSGKGYKARISEFRAGSRTYYRVRLGRYRTLEDAQELARDLSAMGYTPAVMLETR